MFCTGRSGLVQHQLIDTRLVLVALRLGANVLPTPDEVTRSFIDLGLLQRSLKEEKKEEKKEEEGEEEEEEE